MKNELMVLPSCPSCGSQMVYRPAHTPEQAWCGTWYECSESRCNSSVLLHSPALAAMYEDYYKRHPDKRPKGRPAGYRG